MFSVFLLLPVLLLASKHFTNAEVASNHSQIVLSSVFDFETPYIAKCFLSYKKHFQEQPLKYSVTSVFYRTCHHHHHQHLQNDSFSVPIASFTSVGRSLAPAFVATSGIDRLLYSRQLGLAQEVTLVQACTKQSKRAPCLSNPVLTANHGRVISIDHQLRTLANQYIDIPFIHSLANRHTKEFRRHIPSGPKMNSIKEIASVTWPAPVEVLHPCGGNEGKGLLAVIFVFCVVSDISRRMTIRETFGSALKNNSQTEIYFVVGRVDNEAMEDRLQKEAEYYNDILQFDFNDHYFNLTLKSIAMLRWTAVHCSQAKFIFKLDNDCYIRVNPFLKQMTAFSGDTIYGIYRINEPVMRTGKWAIDEWYYPHSTYPPYHAGPYLIPGPAALKLYEAILSEPTQDTIPALPIDDAYITGILPEKINYPRASFTGLRELHDRSYFQKNDRENVKYLSTLTVYFETLGDVDLRRIWRQFGVD